MTSYLDILPNDDLLPPVLTRRATIGDPVYDNAVARQKRKAVAVACERCRRRKIRCDGFQPCSTCARFSVRCVKSDERRERSSSTTDTAALADRVRQLEARLAAKEQNLAVTGGPFDDTGGSSQPPALHLQTDFDDMSSPFPYEESTPMSLSVPAIQVTGPQGGMPSSPMGLSPNSPAPSLFSGTSRASTPDSFAATAWMGVPGPQAYIRTPPMSEWAGFYDSSGLLATPSGGHSRRSSVSSFGGLGPSLCNMNLEDPTSPQDWTDQSSYEFPPWSQEAPAYQTPTRQYAEVLAEHAFNHGNLRLERTAFRLCFEAVYEHDNAPSGSSQANLLSVLQYSFRTAKCLVFLVLAIGSKLYGGEDDSVSESCYAMVHEQMRGIDFWAENGSEHVVGLLALLSEVCKQK